MPARLAGVAMPAKEDTHMLKARNILPTVLLGCLLIAVSASAAFAAPVPVAPNNAPAAAFPGAQGCSCHGELVGQWSKSMHSKALEDPLYLAKVAEANAATDGKIGPFCKKCHGPVAEMTGQAAMELSAMTPGASQGVGCMFCHQVVGTTEPLGNVSQLVEPDTTRRAQLQDPKAPHPAAYSEFHTTSAICGGCHNVNHPINGMHLESTYREWAESPQAKAGIQCQDCHMSKAPGIIGPFTGTAAPGAPERPNLYAMTFAGAQVALGNPELATAMLKSAAKLELDAPKILAAGEEASVTVKTTNVGAGHYLPTGLTEVREMWLEVSLVDAAGNSTPVGEHRFGTVLQDAEGKYPAELWDAVSVYSDDRIAPQQTVEHSFTVALPEGAEEGTVKAELLYRSVPEELAVKAGVENPTTVMASAKQQVFTSAEAAEKAATAASEPADSGTNTWVLVGGAILVAVGLVAGFFWWRKSSAKGA